MGGRLAVVTGAQGFIGRHVTLGLRDQGWTVIGVDRLGPAQGQASASAIRQEQCDVTSRRFGRLMMNWSPDLVVHLAAQSSLAAMQRDPAGALRDNVIGTAAVLEACQHADVPRLVFASSAAVYGRATVLPVTEDSPLQPSSAYGWSKLAGEQLIARATANTGVSAAILRFGNVYGPGQECKDDPGVVSRWLGLLLGGQPVPIRLAGRPTRDFVFVKDVCEAVSAAAESQITGAFNIASGRETSLAELFDLIVGVIGVAPQRISYRAPAGEIDRSVLNPGAAERAFNWQPATPLETGLIATYEHLASISAPSVGIAGARA